MPQLTPEQQAKILFHLKKGLQQVNQEVMIEIGKLIKIPLPNDFGIDLSVDEGLEYFALKCVPLALKLASEHVIYDGDRFKQLNDIYDTKCQHNEHNLPPGLLEIIKNITRGKPAIIHIMDNLDTEKKPEPHKKPRFNLLDN